MTDRELDALIAEKVMGLKLCASAMDKPLRAMGASPAPMVEYPLKIHGKPCGTIPGELGHYSTDIYEAWRVVEKMRQEPEGWEVVVESSIGKWRAEFYPGPEKDAGESGWVETAPRAICLAALRAVGFDVQAQ